MKLLITLAAVLLAGAASLAQAPAKPRPVDYASQIKPLLVKRCYSCHGNGTRLGQFSLESRASMLEGGVTHPVVSPGKGKSSYLIRLVRGEVPGKVMPAKGPRLTPAEIVLLTAWIDQGLPFDAAGSTGAWTPPLGPRRPKLPAIGIGGSTNPIDRLLSPYLAKNKVRPQPVVDAPTFLRRASLDILGLPASSGLRAKIASSRARDGRAEAVRDILANNAGYAEHWFTFWNDMLRNDFAGTGYIDGGRTQISAWLLQALETNKPYDQFVRDLIDPTPESAGFIKGIVWRGVVNASQIPEMQAAQNISQVFMGVNLKCASCHDSFINNWKLSDAYGMASIFSDKPLEMVRCDKPTGQVSSVRFLYPKLGSINAAAAKPEKAAQLAAIVTSTQNGRFARTLVNRVWAKLMGRGLVEPHDEMDQRPWLPDLLDWLSADFADHGYDVKRLIEQIVTSRAYQLPSVPLKSERITEFVFRGPAVKRLSAEQYIDAVSTLTGVWQRPATGMSINKGKPVLPGGANAEVRYLSGLMTAGSAEVDLDIGGAQVLLLVATDAGNGANFDWANWVNPRIQVGKDEISLTKLPWAYATSGYGQVRLNQSAVEKPLRLGDKTYPIGISTHANSVVAFLLPPGARSFQTTVGPDSGGIESKDSQTSVEFFVITGKRRLVEARAALALADPLMRALGRPNRDQVVTQRATVATTLEALELTNGSALAEMLRAGAVRWSSQRASGASALARHIYREALGRSPTAAESSSAVALLGDAPTAATIEDLLWAVIMLPEFQLVY